MRGRPRDRFEVAECLQGLVRAVGIGVDLRERRAKRRRADLAEGPELRDECQRRGGVHHAPEPRPSAPSGAPISLSRRRMGARSKSVPITSNTTLCRHGRSYRLMSFSAWSVPVPTT